MIKVPPLCRKRPILRVFIVHTMVLLNPEMKNAFFNLAFAQIWDGRSHFSAEAPAELLCFASALDDSGVCCQGKALACAM